MRSFRTPLEGSFLNDLQHGVLRYAYRGYGCKKCPLDMTIYMKLIWDLRPQSFIEIGTDKGGSALWFADILSNFNLPAKVISIDCRSSSEVTDARIEFLVGDVNNLSATLNEARLDALARPLLIVEDSAHTFTATTEALRFFSGALRAGDVLVIEDGILDQLGLSEQYDGGPNRAIAEFFARQPRCFEVMTQYCDTYGINATYNPNGYLKKLD